MPKNSAKEERYTIIGPPNNSDSLRTFLDGSTRSHISLKSAVVGFGLYHVGWRWSLHAGAQTGKTSENHIGYILSGHMRVRDPSGLERDVGSGEAFELSPGHDAWVVGTETCTALDFTPSEKKQEKNHEYATS